MAARLTDKQKKMIIADYVELGSYNAVAKRHGVSVTTVIRVCENEETKQKVIEKKEENTLDMLAYMDSKKEQAQGIIDLYLSALADPEKLERATVNNIATALGIIVDKFTGATKNIPANNSANMQSLANLLRNPQPNRNIAEFEAVEDE